MTCYALLTEIYLFCMITVKNLLNEMLVIFILFIAYDG